MSECPYCTPRRCDDGDLTVDRLPFNDRESEIVIGQVRGYSWYIFHDSVLPGVAGPIRFCPMCGRRLEGGPADDPD